ncbi:MAG TPA: sigma-70 family RNA polymerase sigma factor, partial [Solirubrobacteraceae bacterium]
TWSSVSMTTTGETGMTWPPALPFDVVLQRARAADRQALALLYRRFLPVVYQYVLIRLANEHLAEDVTSEVFFAMIEGVANTRASDELGFAAWVLGIARNQVAMHFRRQRTRGETWHTELDLLDLQTVGDEDDPLNVITSREGWAVVAAALERLTEDQRAVVLYRCVLGYSTDEVAALLKKRPKAIRALQSRALATLARHLGIDRRAGRRTSDLREPGEPAREGKHGSRR